MSILHQISLHLKYAYEAIWHHDSQKMSQVEDEPTLYSLSEARTLAELSGKLLKACLDSDKEVLTFIVLKCTKATVISKIYLNKILFF